MSKEEKIELQNILLECVWVSRWNKEKTALTAVLTSEEALKIVDDIFSELEKNNFKIIKNK